MVDDTHTKKKYQQHHGKENEGKNENTYAEMRIAYVMWYDKLDWQASNCEKKRWKTTLSQYFSKYK